MSILSNVLMGFFAHSIEGTEPRIVELEEPVLTVGLSMETDAKSVYRDVPRLGKDFERFKAGTIDDLEYHDERST